MIPKSEVQNPSQSSYQMLCFLARMRIFSEMNPPLKKAVYRKKRHSCPGNFLTIPSEREVTKKERNRVKLSRLQSTKKDLTKGQLISEWLFVSSIFQKSNAKIWWISA